VADLIEVTDVVTDTLVFELRVGDRVEAVLNERMVGTVVEILRPEGAIVGDPSLGQVTVEEPPVVRVAFDNGTVIDFTPQFLRTVAWRWQVLEVKRVP